MSSDLQFRFLEYSRLQGLFGPSDRILVGVSGGADSMALLDLFTRIGQPVVVAHCNFTLRGAESDGDAKFVNDYVAAQRLPGVTTRFNTADYADAQGISLEMAARELRYQWFETIRAEQGCSLIAVAHQADDSIETMLINLMRGTGLRGLTGIPVRYGKVIRPLLFCNRDQIIRYLSERSVPYREDSSNRDIDILRNRIRHRILPEMEQINPGIRTLLLEEQSLFRQLQEMLTRRVAAVLPEIQRIEGDEIRINKKGLASMDDKELILFEILRDYGFTGRQLESVARSLTASPGKIFSTQTHQLLIDRDDLILLSRVKCQIPEQTLDYQDPESFIQAGFEMRILKERPFIPPIQPDTAWLDLDLLNPPLVLRGWRPGDSFRPLGMTGTKKVSDFLIDQRINRFDKERVRVLTHGSGEIIWLTGLRIDHRFRVTGTTLRVLEIRLISILKT